MIINQTQLVFQERTLFQKTCPLDTGRRSAGLAVQGGRLILAGSSLHLSAGEKHLRNVPGGVSHFYQDPATLSLFRAEGAGLVDGGVL